MLQILLQTDTDLVYTFLRLIAGAVIFPYGMQKLLGWFHHDLGGGIGVKETLKNMRSKRMPMVIAWSVILGQSLGSVALILGLFGRIAAAGNFVIFTGALILHARDGWALNWKGKLLSLLQRGFLCLESMENRRTSCSL